MCRSLCVLCLYVVCDLCLYFGICVVMCFVSFVRRFIYVLPESCRSFVLYCARSFFRSLCMYVGSFVICLVASFVISLVFS